MKGFRIAAWVVKGIDVGARRVTALLLFGLLAALWLPASGQEATQPMISTVAGGGSPASGNGDGGLATSARLQEPKAIAVDAAGNIYIAERYTFSVRKVSTSGIITTVAGNGQQAYNGDGIPATAAGIDVRSIAVDPAGNLYIADGANGRVRKVSTTGIISTVAREGLLFPTGVAVNSAGVLYVADGSRIVRVTATGGIEPFAGTGEHGSSGDGGPAIDAQFHTIVSIAVDAWGHVYFVEDNWRVRRVGWDGIVRTIAGGGAFRIDPVATSSHWMIPMGVAVDSYRNVHVAVAGEDVVRIINADGVASDAAGGGPWGGEWLGDGGLATAAWLYQPEAVAVDRQDNLYIADTRNGRIRKVTPVPTPRTPAGIEALLPYVAHAVDGFISQVAIGDVNGDSRDDAVVSMDAPDGKSSVSVFLQNPDGTLGFSKQSAHAEPDMLSAAGLAVADLNEDGFDDAVVGTRTGIRVFLGNAHGLAPGIPYESPNRNARSTLSVNVLDVDRDGRLDVVTLSHGRGDGGGTAPTDEVGLVIHMGNGMGGFSQQTFLPRPEHISWTHLRAEDMNGDGLVDLISGWSDVVDGLSHGGAEITLHNGVAGFRPPFRIGPDLDVSWGHGYAVGDFDADGRKDVIVSRSTHAPQAAYAWLRQRPGGSFVEQATWPAFDHPEELLAADMDGDGRDDLLVYHPDPDQSAISYQQQTDAGLDVGIKYPIPGGGRTRPPSLAVGDLDGDGCKDVAVAHQLQGLIVLSGNCKPLRRLRANGMQPLASSSSPPGTGRRAASSQPATDTFSAPEQPAAIMQRRVPVEAQSASVTRERLRPSTILFLFGLLGIASFAGLWSARSFRW